MKNSFILLAVFSLVGFSYFYFQSLNSKTSPTNSYFQSLIEAERKNLKKCYLTRIDHLKLNKGNLLIEVVFHPEGYVNSVHILKSNFEDKTFLRCIKTSLSRISPEPFQGSLVKLVYPLSF